MNRTWYRYLALSLSLAFHVTSQAAGAKHSPVWSQELVSDLSQASTVGGLHLNDRTQSGVTFLGDTHLIAYAVLRDTGELSQRNRLDSQSSFYLQMWVLDARSGHVEFTRRLSTRFRNSNVEVTSGGILVQTGDTLKVYSQDLEVSHELPLAPMQDVDCTVVSVSPSGKAILIYRAGQQGKVHRFDLLDADTLKLRLFWNESSSPGPYSISDTGMAFKDAGQIWFRDFNHMTPKFVQESDSIGMPAKDRLCDSMDRPVLVTNDLLLHGCSALSLVSVNGKVLLREDLERDTSLAGEVAVARASSSVAVSSIQRRDTGRGIEVSSVRIEIYDLVRRERLSEIVLSPDPQNSYSFALSPDGKAIAVFSDGTAVVYAIPIQ